VVQNSSGVQQWSVDGVSGGILFNPNGNASQTINGPLNLNGFGLSAGFVNSACNAAAQNGVDIGDKINHCISSLPAAPIGGEVLVPTSSSGCYSFFTQITVDRPIFLHGQSTGFSGQGTCLKWTGGATQAIVINGVSGASTHSILEKLVLQNSGSGTVGIDIYNGQYNVTLRDVTVEQGSAAFSVAGIRLGNNLSGSPTIDTLFENVRIATQVVGLQILLANTPMCSPCHIYNASTANVQLGDSNHGVFMATFHGGNIEQDLTNAPNIIVNNAEGVDFYGVYTETTNGGNWMQVPSTAVLAKAIRFHGGRFQCNGSTTNIFNLNFSGTELTVEGSFVQNCPAGSVLVQNTASRRVWLNDISAVDNNLSLYSVNNDSSGVANFGSTQQDPLFKNLLPLGDQAALGSRTNRWDASLYIGEFFRSQGNPTFPDIVGDGTHSLVIAGKIDGTGNVVINAPTFNTGIGNSGTGMMHVRQASCTTPASLNGACSTTLNWPGTWADDNYTATCFLDGQNTGLDVEVSNMGSKTTTSMVVEIVNRGTNNQASSGIINCIGMHD
jgi:hypothetical protein